MDTVLPYVHERKQFGQKIGEFQVRIKRAIFGVCRGCVTA